jgi:hypothetical protein
MIENSFEADPSPYIRERVRILDPDQDPTTHPTNILHVVKHFFVQFKSTVRYRTVPNVSLFSVRLFGYTLCTRKDGLHRPILKSFQNCYGPLFAIIRPLIANIRKRYRIES